MFSESLVTECTNVITYQTHMNLLIAISENNVPEVERLCQEGIDVNVTSGRGTPLEHAVSRDHNEITEILLRHGANANVKDENGSTPLHQAANNGNYQIVEHLLEYGANTEAMSNLGETPLMVAWAWKCPKVNELLVRYGANVNTTTPNGWTPLRKAVHFKQKQQVQLFLNNGSIVGDMADKIKALLE